MQIDLPLQQSVGAEPEQQPKQPEARARCVLGLRQGGGGAEAVLGHGGDVRQRVPGPGVEKAVFVCITLSLSINLDWMDTR